MLRMDGPPSDDQERGEEKAADTPFQAARDDARAGMDTRDGGRRMAQAGRTLVWSMNFRCCSVAGAPELPALFMGQGISLVGTWMQMTAVAWLVWR